MSATPPATASPAPDASRRRSKPRLALWVVVVLYLPCLAWGYVRLPWASVRSLGDYPIIAQSSAVTFDALDTSSLQRRYLKTRLVESPTPVVPRISVTVKWNALICARTHSAVYFSPTGAEGKDSVYVCVFGAWIEVYTFSHRWA